MCGEQETQLPQELVKKRQREAGIHFMMKGCIMHVRQLFNDVE
jgi:hypothetical protein